VINIIFCRSNIELSSNWCRYPIYRPSWLLTLIICSIAAFTLLSPAFADDSETDWPEPVFFPQTQNQQANTATPTPTPVQVNPPGTAKKTAKPKKKGWLAKRRETNQPPLTDAQITKVGPYDPPPSPYPLFRLPMPILTGTGTIPLGIYLVKPIQNTTTPTANPSNSDISLVLTQKDRVIFSFKAHPCTQADENVALTGTPSPLTRTTPASSLVTRVESRLSEDLKTLTIVITEGERRFESDPFPVNTDTRHILTF
jgi:hypothetical protein